MPQVYYEIKTVSIFTQIKLCVTIYLREKPMCNLLIFLKLKYGGRRYAYKHKTVNRRSLPDSDK